MKVFLVYVRDENFFRLLPKELDRSRSDNGRIKVMGFPPLGIQTLAPVLRRLGYLVQMFDTCHPEMQAEHIAQAGAKERPDVIALAFLSTTTYPTVKNLAKRLKLNTPHIPIIVGGAFATMNAEQLLRKVSLNCRGHPLWLPILWAATEGRPYVYFVKRLGLRGTEIGFLFGRSQIIMVFHSF